MEKKSVAHYLLPVLALLCLTPYVSSATALMIGAAVALVFGNPYMDKTKKMTHTLLALAVVGLGAGMNLEVVGLVGFKGIGYTVIGITGAVILGLALGKFFKTEKDTSLLVTIGTAICGGSAIAAVSPVINAKPHEVSISLGIVFMLNAVALIAFPIIGHHFNLTETQFGLWGALAIHDTSSVVGATMHYGPLAMKIGTTVKLARALWIIPVASIIGLVYKHQNKGAPVANAEKPKRPWFILGFIIMAGLVTWIPALRPTGHIIEHGAKQVLILTLFLIGTNLTKETLQKVGFRPFLQGIILWIITTSLTLAAILSGWIDL